MTIEQELSPRRFVLQRLHDPSGTSGTGLVCEGVEFSDGTVAIRWRSSIKSTVVYDNVKAAVAIHGHGGATRLVWLDPEGGFRMAAPPPANDPVPETAHDPDAVESEGGLT